MDSSYWICSNEVLTLRVDLAVAGGVSPSAPPSDES